jgi:ceramide glucosyltransferase
MVFAGLAVIGLAYQAFAWIMLGRFFAPHASAASSQSVTILKPLHGDEPRLKENLATFLAQDHAGQIQLLCGIGRADDPARLAVEALRREYPGADIGLVIDPTRHGSNGKVGNLINLMPAAKHGVLVLSDSDMAVGRDYLPTLLATLGLPGVGVATCFYRGRADGGFWSQVSAGIIGDVALPDMVVGYTTGLARPCMGSTIALTRATLDRIGGFAPYADMLADDHAIGMAVTRLGLRVEIPPLTLVHACAETSFGAVWRQKLRWGATIRTLQPWGYAGSLITRPLPLALLAVPFIPATGLVLSVAALAVRLAVARRVDRRAGARSVALWLLPLIDLVEFLVFAASFTVRKVNWRGNALTLTADGHISA